MRARLARRREAVHEADFRSVSVRIRQELKAQLVRRAREFRARVFCALPSERVLSGIAPLHDEVVLRAHDRQAIEVALVHERLDVRDMLAARTWESAR